LNWRMNHLLVGCIFVSQVWGRTFLIETKDESSEPRHEFEAGQEYSEDEEEPSGYNEYHIVNNNGFHGTVKNGSIRAWLDKIGCLEHWEKNLQLGDAYLATSAKSECAIARFTIGLLALHNFQYELAAEMFEKAAETERRESGRGYPMAWWGAAVSTTQILWSSSECKKGKKYLKKIPKKMDWVSEKEYAYIKTGYAFYPKSLTCAQDNDQFVKEKRIFKGFQKLTTKYPEETEAALFYAVALTATLKHDKKKTDKFEKARKLLEALEQNHPTHPGVIHYTIHLLDTPVLFYEGNKHFLDKMIEPIEQKDHAASVARRASDNYLKVATSGCHALHMPSHIYMRFGNWSRALDSNLVSVKACDDFSKERGFSDEDLYDQENLYHSIEYAQYGFLQRGQYKEANNLLLRINRIIDKLGGAKEWKKTKSMIGKQHRMHTRQLTEAFEINQRNKDIFGCMRSLAREKVNKEREPRSYEHKCTNGLHGSMVAKPITDGEIIYAARAELGILLIYTLRESWTCALNKKKSCKKNPILKWAVKQSKNLKEDLKSRKSVEGYTKSMAKMLYHVILGMVDLADKVRPHGLECLARGSCKHGDGYDDIVNKIMKGPLQKAAYIQKTEMIQSAATPSLLFMPSYEVYGHVLLFFEKYAEAKEMFEASLEDRAGRSLSLLGLARAHSMLGNKQKADYFYLYLKTQLQQADKGNLMVEEAKLWTESKIPAEKLRNQWFWPYFTTPPRSSYQ